MFISITGFLVGATVNHRLTKNKNMNIIIIVIINIVINSIKISSFIKRIALDHLSLLRGFSTKQTFGKNSCL